MWRYFSIRTARKTVSWALVLAGLSSGCHGRRAANTAEQRPARPLESTAAQRQTLALTVYNSNFGLVRERRTLELGEGPVQLSFSDVAALLQPETVQVAAVDAPKSLTVLEQNYRYDLLTPETLLKKYVGKTLRVLRYNEQLGREEEKTAEVLATEHGTVLRIDGEISYGLPGRLAFPKLPEELVSKPTLVWLLESQRARQQLEVTYLTQGLNWAADYVLVLDPSEQSADLSGWVSLTNESGASFENATLSLVAGDVQHLLPAAPVAPELPPATATTAPGGAPRSENLLEYHLYTLDRPTTLRDREKKQVSLLEAHDVPVSKKLVLQGSDYYFRPVAHAPIENQKVDVQLVWNNDAQSHLGQPLPKGVVRVYKADRGGARQFVGEDRLDHTARDERVKLSLGQAFDLVADRKELSTKMLSSCLVESEWRIELRNHKESAEVVEVREAAAGDFELVSSSLPAQREDARTFTFSVPVQARAKAELGYRVRVRYCADPAPRPAISQPNPAQ